MRRTFFIIPVLLISCGYGAWSYVTSKKGDQRVDYRPALKECSASKIAGWPVHYCIYSANAGSNGGIAYFLHGRNLDENSWNDDTFYTAQIQHYWSEHNVIPPKGVSVSIGPSWLLAPKGSQAKTGLLELLTQTVIPEIESKTGKPRYRAVFGESMGGTNSLIAGLATKGVFQKVASLCPGIYKESPFSSLQKISEFLHRTGADPKAIFGIILLAKQYASDDREWEKISPYHLIQKIDINSAPEIYLSCGLYDKYVNYEGSQSFAETAKARKIKIQWLPSLWRTLCG